MSHETEYVTLAHAATLLNTDIESVLAVALNGAMTLYWPLNQTILAELVYWEPAGDDGSPSTRMIMNHEHRAFSFVPVTQTSLTAIVNKGAADVSADPMSLPDEDGFWWEATDDSRTELPTALGIQSVFVKRTDCEVSAPAQEMHARTKNNMFKIVAAVLKEHKVDYAGRGIAKYLETLTQQLGAPVSEDTIKKYLDEIPNALKSRMK